MANNKISSPRVTPPSPPVYSAPKAASGGSATAKQAASPVTANASHGGSVSPKNTPAPAPVVQKSVPESKKPVHEEPKKATVTQEKNQPAKKQEPVSTKTTSGGSTAAKQPTAATNTKHPAELKADPPKGGSATGKPVQPNVITTPGTTYDKQGQKNYTPTNINAYGPSNVTTYTASEPRVTSPTGNGSVVPKTPVAPPTGNGSGVPKTPIATSGCGNPKFTGKYYGYIPQATQTQNRTAVPAGGSVTAKSVPQKGVNPTVSTYVTSYGTNNVNSYSSSNPTPYVTSYNAYERIPQSSGSATAKTQVSTTSGNAIPRTGCGNPKFTGKYYGYIPQAPQTKSKSVVPTGGSVTGKPVQQNTTTSSRYTISSASGDTVSVPDYPYFDKGTALFLGFDTGTGGMITGVMDDVYSHTGKPYDMKEVIDFNKKNTYNFEDHYNAGTGLGTLTLLSTLFTPTQGVQVEGTFKGEADFYVAPNGKTLPGQYKNWLSRNMRESLINSVEDPTLKKAIGEVYRPGSIIGDGGTADIIRFEQETGILLSKSGHTQKAIDMSKYFQKLVDSGTLSPTDTKVAQDIIKGLNESLGGK